MKSYHLTLTLLIGGLLLSPAAIAQQLGMDEEYNQGLYNQAQAESSNSTAVTGTTSYTTQDNAWQDMGYIQGQQQAQQQSWATQGTLQAPLQPGPLGTVSTFRGNTAQFIRGASFALGRSLPRSHTGLNALNGGYFGAACGEAGAGGFFGAGGGSRIYPGLPPTSTSIVDLNTAF